MSLHSIRADRVVLLNEEGKDFMEFEFHYHQNSLLVFSFDIKDFQEVFVDNYSTGSISVLFFDGKLAICGFQFSDEGVSSNDDTEYLYLLSEILAFEIINNLPS